MLTQVARFAHIYDVSLYGAEMDVRAEFDAGDKMGLGGPGAAFDRVSYNLSIESDSPAEAVQKLAAHAERGCHVAQTLRNPVEVIPRIVLNGVELDEE